MATAQGQDGLTTRRASLQQSEKEAGKRAENAVRKHYDKLCDAIDGSIARVADKCNEKKIITSGAKRTITSRMTSQDDYQRASDLIGKVKTTVKLIPSKLEDFLLILLEVEIEPSLVKSIADEYGGSLPRLAGAYRPDIESTYDQMSSSLSPGMSGANTLGSEYSTCHELLNQEGNRDDIDSGITSLGYETTNDFQSVASAATLDRMSSLSLESDDIDEDKRLIENALKKSSFKLAEAISLNIVTKVANKCNERAIISTGVKNTINSRNTLQDEYERASDLMEKVRTSIKNNPNKFEDFLIILVEVEVDADLIVEIAQSYGKRLPRFFEHIKDMPDQFRLLTSSDGTVRMVENNREEGDGISDR